MFIAAGAQAGGQGGTDMAGVDIVTLDVTQTERQPRNAECSKVIRRRPQCTAAETPDRYATCSRPPLKPKRGTHQALFFVFDFLEVLADALDMRDGRLPRLLGQTAGYGVT